VLCLLLCHLMAIWPWRLAVPGLACALCHWNPVPRAYVPVLSAARPRPRPSARRAEHSRASSPTYATLPSSAPHRPLRVLDPAEDRRCSAPHPHHLAVAPPHLRSRRLRLFLHLRPTSPSQNGVAAVAAGGSPTSLASQCQSGLWTPVPAGTSPSSGRIASRSQAASTMFSCDGRRWRHS
jgi:hypothetical protein